MVAPIVNPYARKEPKMGPQSQRRLSLQARTYQLKAQATNQGHSNKRKKGGQQTLFGDQAFEPEKDCVVCKARLSGRTPHRPHHRLCWNNKRTKGVVSVAALQQQQIDKSLKKHFETPLNDSEKASGYHTSKEAVEFFFNPPATTKVFSRQAEKSDTTTTTTTAVMDTASDFCHRVNEKLKDTSFLKEHANSRAPLAMLAFAGIVVEKINRTKEKATTYFDGLTLTVPPCKDMYSSPSYHSIAGQQLLLVDWKRMFDLQITCPTCDGCLVNDRTNFSKNKILFPIFQMSGAPSWAMVMSMRCECCHRRYNANDARVLARVPPHIASAYPVEQKHALPGRNCHIGRSATEVVFDSLMTTYGNGDLCSRLLYSALNRAYLERVIDYYSYNKHAGLKCPPYIEKDGCFITTYPPLGDLVRDMTDEAMSNPNTPWELSDHDRNTREMQGTSSALLYAEDHTHQVVKNYFGRRQIGAVALWDMATETGEIATAVIVPSTKTKDLAHAAAMVSRRPHFNPVAMYSDRWPTKSDFWNRLYGPTLEGRLGLFHYLQRMIKTLRKTHCDYFQAVNLLLDSVYFYHEPDYEKLLVVLKDGTLSSTGKKHSDEEIAELKTTKLFRQRYAKHLRKVIRPPNIMCERLDNFFIRYKCSASPGSAPGLGRLDPTTKETLFTMATKDAVRNCKINAKYLQDPLPLEAMYDEIPPNPNSPHGLSEFLSRRGESNLEAFHLMLAHFANTGMRATLADNLNLSGTARYNLSIRHKLRICRLAATNNQGRARIPAAWETVVSFTNHSELAFVNTLAIGAGVDKDKIPFPMAEKLIEDNGERFFSEYLAWLKEEKPKCDVNDICECSICRGLSSPVINATTMTAPDKDVPEINCNQRSQTPISNVPSPDPLTNRAAQLPVQRQQQQYVMAPPVPIAFYNPFLVHLPPPPSPFCCVRYREYCFRDDKRGRPPHDNRCYYKRQNNNSNNSSCII